MSPRLAAFLLVMPAVVSAQAATGPGANRAGRLIERARQDREIVYFLQQPETNSFDLYHDYTESRPGVDRYLNIVRAGSRASNPSALILDTGDIITHAAIDRARVAGVLDLLLDSVSDAEPEISPEMRHAHGHGEASLENQQQHPEQSHAQNSNIIVP